MKIHRDALPDSLVNGAIQFKGVDFGELNVCHISLPAGADATPLLEGLPQNLCQCPHWGMVLKGSINVRYADGKQEKVSAGEVYYWPPGHTVWVDEDYNSIEFSPKDQMAEVIDHLKVKLGA
ncbi:MAG: hypothetical protein JWO33_1527 [Caulobacteraceae bacterium]|nr:hypothetical protein [Caulobacteraceae bacterium]